VRNPLYSRDTNGVNWFTRKTFAPQAIRGSI
jgi:hypothetical protein